jgi:ATP-binding protein involved in chromosome partitioning
MADKVNIEILGIIENMSYFQAAPDQPPIYIFGRGGGQRLAEVQGVPLLGEIPLDQAIREGGDEGVPIVLSAPESSTAKAFRTTADKLIGRLPVPVA